MSLTVSFLKFTARVRGWWYTRFGAPKLHAAHTRKLADLGNSSKRLRELRAQGIATSSQTSLMMKLANAPRAWTEDRWQQRYGTPMSGSQYVKVSRALRSGVVPGGRSQELDFILWLEASVRKAAQE